MNDYLWVAIPAAVVVAGIAGFFAWLRTRRDRTP